MHALLKAVYTRPCAFNINKTGSAAPRNIIKRDVKWKSNGLFQKSEADRADDAQIA